MADKGNTWFGGTGVITGGNSGAQTPVSTARTRNLRTILIVVAVSLGSAFVLLSIPEPWAWELLRVMAVGLVLLSLFFFPAERIKPGFVIWGLMLTSDCIFFHEGDESAAASAYQGSFPTAVYGEVMMWILCLLTVFFFSTKLRGYAKELFTGDYKWMTAFALICVGSSVYSPRPAFSLVWGFKLALMVLIAMLCAMEMRDFHDVLSFLRFSFVGYAVVAFQPVIISMLRGQMFDEEGRMSMIENPDALSADAATVFVLALTLFSRVKDEGIRASAMVFGFSGFIVMVLAGGKAGILSGVVAGGLYFLIRRGFGTTMGFVIVAALGALLLVSFTPMGDYLTKYQSGGTATTLSGRTLLWSAVFPAILARPIFGHGYVASTFVYMQVNAAGWSAPQLHNGFIEAAYNNGGLGFGLILLLNVVMLRNLYRVVRRTPPSDPLYRIGAGCLSLYVLMLINGMFNASFGGRARPPFILFLGMVVVSDKLLKLTSRPEAQPRLTMLGN